jgi:hypothetical protein
VTATLLEPFGYGYMINAMGVSALVGGVCAFLSAYLIFTSFFGWGSSWFRCRPPPLISRQSCSATSWR